MTYAREAKHIELETWSEVDFKDEKDLAVHLPSTAKGLVFIKANTTKGQLV